MSAPETHAEEVERLTAERAATRATLSALLTAHVPPLALAAARDLRPDLFASLTGQIEALVRSLVAERDELRLALLAERGDQAGALPGWEAEGGPAFRLGHTPIRGYVFRAQTHPLGEPWEWQRFEGGSLVAFGYAVGPREAMRAAMEGA